MITVISHGDPSKSPTYTRTCPECGCKFTYQYRDCIDANIYGGYSAVLCPDCRYPVAHLTAGGGADINHPAEED